MDSQHLSASEPQPSKSHRRLVPPPLTSLPSVIPGSRTRSATLTSLDSTMTSTGSFTATTGCTAGSLTPLIRPRALLPSSYSFDSGFEVSPLYAPRSFRYGDSAGSSTAFPQMNGAPAAGDELLLDDSMDGFDQELISIGQHFTPIAVPTTTTSSSTTSRKSSSNVFSFDGTVDLANERRLNRLSRSTATTEVNNNDPAFPNQNQTADDVLLDIFPFDEEGDDDVFYQEDDQEDEDAAGEGYLGEGVLQRESRSWHIARPSCHISESDPDFVNHQASRSFLYSADSAASSRPRSSTPIPIPGSVSGSENGFDAMDGASDSVPATEQSFIADPSVPPRRTRMPYFHRMAPPLNPRNPLGALEQSSSQQANGSPQRKSNGRSSAGGNTRRTVFGTHFETSCSIISRNLVPSRFSPVPFHSRWYPNPPVNSAQSRPGAGAMWLRFGRLPASPTYPLRAIPANFRALTPHLEVAEEKVLSPSASSYGMVFNFSQLAVNEISGQEMDLEVPEEDGDTENESAMASQPASDLNDAPAAVATGRQNQQAQQQPQQQATIGCGLRREPLPDIVSSHRSSFMSGTRKHVHRNTLPSFSGLTENVSSMNLQERRTMSVSLPIEEQVISQVASQLRQISSDFSSSRQIQRLNPLTSLSPILDLLSSTLYGGGSPRNGGRPLTRRQTFNGSASEHRQRQHRVVNNSRFYTSPATGETSPQRQQTQAAPAAVPTPTTTGNSTFYLGSSTTTTTSSGNRRK